MRSFSSLLIGSTLLVLAAAPTNAITMMVGQADDFAAPIDLADPSSEIQAVLVPYGGTNHLDQTLGINDGQGNAQVAHTFENLPKGIIGATLELKIKAGIGQTETDGIYLSFVDWWGGDFKNSVRYARSFGPTAAHPPLYAFDDPGLVQYTPWTQGESATIRLNLGNLPLPQGGAMSLIQDMNWRRFLDVTVGDETAVDYMKLELALENDGGGKGNKWHAVLATPSIITASPNPARGSTAVEFALPSAGDVTLRVFDVSGRSVASIERAGLAAGRHSLDWNTRDMSGRKVPAGVYFYRVEGVAASKTHKVTVLR